MAISRRSVLRTGAGAVVAAGLAALPGAVARAGGPTIDWPQLGRHLQGTLVLPGNSSYAEAKQLFFSEFDAINPAAIAYCRSAADVATCLKFAHDNSIRATARSGGHSPAGFSLTSGLVIDVSRLDAVSGDAAAVVLGPGAQQVDVLDALAPAGLAFPGGLCPTVGAGGFVQGGGIGMLTRRYGLACDHLVAAEVVLADGRRVCAREDEEPDLFWALRGGGGGNFGIVTSYTVTPVPVTRMINFSTSWSWDDAAAVLSGWQHWAAGGPRQIGSGLTIQLSDAAPGNVPIVAIFGAWTGTPEDLDAALDDLQAKIGRAPASRVTQDLTYRDAMMQRYSCSDKTVGQCHRVGTSPGALLPRTGFTVERSRLYGTALPASAVDEVLTAFAADRRPGHGRGIHGACLFGGRAGEVAPDATAFVHRSAEISLSFSAALPTSTPAAEDKAAAEAWAATGLGVLSKYSGSTYQNFVDPRLADWRSAYYGANYDRLAAVKHAYDPYRFFTFPQAIG
ncbi:FAD-binding oxidoreductase [Amycolatopsis sp. CA-126428]|uniref:FAD-binding oxidoreductase n=1 Tax=Amycolatopsis sp. CA-126428 TaxID=2073158 RepID=UPI000CD114BA|nr:FAD-binding oxidoreductase [Amycolatopsis sp. CA-126428]